MMRLRFGGQVLGVGIVAALSVGCGGQTAITSGMPLSAARDASAARGGSWMSPAAEKVHKLIYVSEFLEGTALVYDYETGEREGKLTGFNQPTGLCVDAVGDVWIAQADGQSVTEFAHGGTTPIKTLSTSGRAFGCSVSPNGDLAVANFDVGSAPGSIQVFKGAAGTPKQYSCPGFGYYSSPGYDGEGNLYVEVLNNLNQSKVGVCMLPAGGNALEPVKVNVTINEAGSVMWDGKYITLTERDYQGSYTTAVYQAAEGPSGNLTVVGATVLVDRSGQPAGGSQPFILGRENTPGNMQQGRVLLGLGDNVLDYWRYPRGGKPRVLIPISSKRNFPFGESVSIAK